MESEWPTVPLSRIANLRSGYSFKSSDWRESGVPVIKIANVKAGRIQPEGCGFVSDSVASSASHWMTKDGDILIAMTGYVGEVATVRTGERYLINQRVGRFDFLSNSPVRSGFLYYYLRQPVIRSVIEDMARGSAQPNLSAGDAAKLLVPVAPPEQQELAISMGRCLDDRIDLLRQTNATLEAIARALFKSWFVDFDPVRAKAEGREPEGLDAATAALFPSEFDESEMGLIPKGWRALALGDVATQVKGSVNPLTTPESHFEHFSLPAFDAGKMPALEKGDAIKSNKTPVPSGAVLVSKLNPHIPRIWLVGNVGAAAVCSTEFIGWSAKHPANDGFVYCLTASEPFNSAMRQLVTGTSNSHQRVKPDQLASIRVVAGSDRTVTAFGLAAAPLLSRVVLNRKQAGCLAQIRDTLLPRLISGKLRLPEAESIVEQAVT